MQVASYLKTWTEYVFNALLSTKANIKEEFKSCWLFRDNMVVINGVMMKSRRTLEPASLQRRTLMKLHIKHMGIEKMILLPREPIYLININVDNKNAFEKCSLCFEFQAM